MKDKSWREKSYDMYFNEHMDIREIAGELGVTRQTVSEFLQRFAEFAYEKHHRRTESTKRRKAYKKDWYITQKRSHMTVDGESLKREHFEAVRVLSCESRY